MTSAGHEGTAEERFRAAFERLKSGIPTVLAPGAQVTQNNVAREAGCDPSALRKGRFSALVSEIQSWVDEARSPLESEGSRRHRARALREQLANVKAERDSALSLLVEADALILALTAENSHLRSLLPTDRSAEKVVRLPTPRTRSK